ncbi:MAG: BatA domain-containing protein, partial [Akkermansiaceae bacterium]
MLFLNSILLAGLAGVLIPIILHLIRRQAAKPLDWGAMRFLFDTVAMRKRRMEWEDMLLMATRCLLLALIALAIARPFVPPNSSVPWVVVLPLSLLGVAAIAGSVVLSDRKPRWLVRLIGVVCILLAIAAVVWERRLNLKRFRLEGGRDVALVIDASTSMTLPQGNQTSFEAAIEEAREIVKNSPRGTAFSVILGGPAPELKTATPLTHRADVLEVLDQLRPVGGPFRAQDALGVATLSLAQGENTGKEILVLSDSQRIGWRTDSPSAWSSLADAMDSLPRKPRLMVRSFPPPEDLRNVAISSIDMSREVIGTDRPATLYVTVENTGNAAITPGKIQLTVNGSEVSADEHVGQLVPGQQETVEFRHRFKTVGAQVVMAHIDVKDDLPEDDRFERIVIARKRLPVILVDGNPSGSFFERAAGFTALALAPAADLVRDGKTKSDYLMEPVVITAPEVANLKEIAPNSVIVLADVPRLPASVAQQIEQFVANGGGLLVLSGQRADESFYNAWQGGDGQVLPLQLGKTQTEKDGISPAEETFDHAAL